MSEVSRPLQVVLVLTVAFTALWFVALRPKGDNVAAPTPAPAPVKTQPAPKNSSLPGGLGRAVDKAKATQAQANAAAAAADGKPAAAAPAKPAATAVKPAAPAPSKPAAPAAPVHRAARQVVRGATPGNVRQALRADHVAVLLFYNPLSSDDRAVRGELGSVDRRGGHVAVWSVGLSGLGRFKNVLRGIDVVQSPSVVVLSRKGQPRVLEGYTDHAEIDQATLVALLS
jgi:hypothetical protein